METVVQKLLNYGVLGVVCVLLLLALRHLYKAKETQQEQYALEKEALHKKYQDELQSQQAEHKEELDTIVQRHITKAETWVEKGNELAANLHRVLESLTTRKG